MTIPKQFENWQRELSTRQWAGCSEQEDLVVLCCRRCCSGVPVLLVVINGASRTIKSSRVHSFQHFQNHRLCTTLDTILTCYTVPVCDSILTLSYSHFLAFMVSDDCYRKCNDFKPQIFILNIFYRNFLCRNITLSTNVNRC